MRKFLMFLMNKTPSPLTILLLISFFDLIFAKIFKNCLSSVENQLIVVILDEIFFIIFFIIYLFSISTLTVREIIKMVNDKSLSKNIVVFKSILKVFYALLLLNLPSLLHIYFYIVVYNNTNVQYLKEVYFNTLRILGLF